MKTSITPTDSPKLFRFLRGLAAFLFWIGVWAVLAAVVDKEVLLPSPRDVARVLGSLLMLPSYWGSIAASLGRILLGFVIGCVAAVLLSVLCFRFSIADALISPVLSVIRAVPVASFIILALVWIGRSGVPTFSAFLMVLPIFTGNIIAGLKAADPSLREVCVIYHFRLFKKVRLLYLPAVRPYFLSAARTSLGMAWKAGIAAEVLCSLSSSIGGQIYDAKVYLETASLFAWTITVICISMLIEKLLFRLPGFKGETAHPKEADV